MLQDAIRGTEQNGASELALAMRRARMQRACVALITSKRDPKRTKRSAKAAALNYPDNIESDSTEDAMDYRIIGLSPEPFLALYGLSDAALAERSAKRYRVESRPGYPDRIEIRDVDPGESVILTHYEHQAGPTPYRASHAIYIREGAERAATFFNEVPDTLKLRSLSVRAFDADHWMIDADLCEGPQLEGLVRKLLSSEKVDYLHVHFAKRGCYAARVERS